MQKANLALFFDAVKGTTKFKTMNTTEMLGNWNILKGKLKLRYAELTDDDLIYVEGAEDELYGRLQVKLGKTKQEILDSVEKIVNSTF